MPRFQTENSGEGASAAPGVYRATIIDFVDITERVRAFADKAIEVKVNAEGIGFDLKTTIFIKYDRKANGELDPSKNSWSNHINSILDAIDYTGGFDRFGTFRDASGEEVDDIAGELAKWYMDKFPNYQDYNFLVYVEQDKKGYTVIKRKIFKSTQRDKMDEYVAASNRLKARTPSTVSTGSGSQPRKL
mgnify:CR=1 FL=1